VSDAYVISQICDLFNQVNCLVDCPKWARHYLHELADIPAEDTEDGGVEMILLLCTFVDADELPSWVRVEARRLAATAHNPYFQAAATIKREVACLCVRHPVHPRKP
jgi:hypothetical protein